MTSRKRSANVELQEKSDQRKARMQATPNIVYSEWETIDVDKNTYRIIETNDIEPFATFKTRESNTLSSIFHDILSQDVLQQIWDSYDISNWGYSNHGCTSYINKGVFDSKLILKFLAVEIRIIGYQESDDVERPLRGSLKKQMSNIQREYPDVTLPGRALFEILHARFLIAEEHFDLISKKILAKN